MFPTTQVAVVRICVPKLAKTRGRVFFEEGENDADTDVHAYSRFGLKISFLFYI